MRAAAPLAVVVNANRPPAHPFLLEDQMAKYSVVEPDPEQLAQLYVDALERAVQAGAVRVADVDALLRARGVWDDDKQAEADRLWHAIFQLQQRLAQPDLPRERAEAAAERLQKLRARFHRLLAPRRAAVSQTAEGQAFDAVLDFVLRGVVDTATGRPAVEVAPPADRPQIVKAVLGVLARVLPGLFNPDGHPEDRFLLGMA